jgi:hypothetical protein
MIAELSQLYHVRVVTAVLKAENRRSFRLLERLGFSLGPSEPHAEHGVEPGEILMQLEVPGS